MKRRIFLALLLLACATNPAFSQLKGGFFLTPGNVVVQPGHTVRLKLYATNEEMLINDTSVVEAVWTLNGNPSNRPNTGDGSLSPDLNGEATYTAPNEVPKRNPVAVTISFRPNKSSKTLLMLTCNVTVADIENYFHITAPGGMPDACTGERAFAPTPRSYISASNSSAVYLNGELQVNVMGTEQGHSSNILGIAVSVAGDHTGNYPWSITYTKDKGVTAPSNSVSVNLRSCQGGGFVSTDELPHGSDKSVPVSLKGFTTIGVNKEKKLVQGNFAGQVVNISGGTYHYAYVYGLFTVHLP